jgi:hypothetical protein
MFVQATSINCPVVCRVKIGETLESGRSQPILPQQVLAPVSSRRSHVFGVEPSNAKGCIKQVDRVPACPKATEIVSGQMTPEDRVYGKVARPPDLNRISSCDNRGIHLFDRVAKPPFGKDNSPFTGLIDCWIQFC